MIKTTNLLIAYFSAQIYDEDHCLLLIRFKNIVQLSYLQNIFIISTFQLFYLQCLPPEINLLCIGEILLFIY